MKPPNISTHAEWQNSQIYKSNTKKSPSWTKTKQKGRGSGEREGRRQLGPRTSGKLLAPKARTGEGEEGGSKRPTFLPSPEWVGGGGGGGGGGEGGEELT
jgi:hypothetical protein